MSPQTSQQAAISVAHSMVTIAAAATKIANCVERWVDHTVHPYAPFKKSEDIK